MSHSLEIAVMALAPATVRDEHLEAFETVARDEIGVLGYETWTASARAAAETATVVFRGLQPAEVNDARAQMLDRLGKWSAEVDTFRDWTFDVVVRFVLVPVENEVYRNADLFRAFDVARLSEWPSGDPDERGEQLRRATALAGCVIGAAAWCVDEMFDDLVELAADTVEASSLSVLSELPPRYADRYDYAFAQRFLLVLSDLTARLNAPWKGLTCVAQELALRLVFNRVAALAENEGVELPDGWRGWVEDLMFEDLDHEWIYDKSMQGLVDLSGELSFEHWFEPFNKDDPMPLHARDEMWRPDDH